MVILRAIAWLWGVKQDPSVIRIVVVNTVSSALQVGFVWLVMWLFADVPEWMFDIYSWPYITILAVHVWHTCYCCYLLAEKRRLDKVWSKIFLDVALDVIKK